MGGSYVTDRFKPSDIDVALDLRNEPRAAPSLRVVARLRADFLVRGLDLLPVLAGQQNFVEFLQQIKPFECMLNRLPPNSRKGILQVI